MEFTGARGGLSITSRNQNRTGGIRRIGGTDAGRLTLFTDERKVCGCYDFVRINAVQPSLGGILSFSAFGAEQTSGPGSRVGKKPEPSGIPECRSAANEMGG